MEQIQPESIKRLTKDLRDAAKTLGIKEVRYLVDLYYQIQDFRIQAAAQIRSMSDDAEPTLLIEWVFQSQARIESEIKRVLDIYTDTEPTGMGAWAKSICGIGPVLSSGLLSHIDMSRAPTVGHVWSFAGLDPTKKWEKKTKRPWNARLKVLCWKIGESFVKVQNKESDIYGKIYAKRKIIEQERNESGQFADQAKLALEAKKIGKTTEAHKHYAIGQLPPAHIHARARRYAVKLFLAHWWEEAYRRHYGTEPPLPYPIAHLGHVHKI